MPGDAFYAALAERLAGSVTAVDTNAEEITVSAAHDLLTGTMVRLMTSGGSMPGGVSSSAIYFAIPHATDRTKFRLAATYAAAVAASPLVNLTSAGSSVSVIAINNPWLLTVHLDAKSFHLTGIGASASVQPMVHSGLEPTPGASGVALGAAISTPTWRNITENFRWFRAAYTLTGAGDATLAKGYLSGRHVRSG